MRVAAAARSPSAGSHQRQAAIDIGTNTVLLLIAERNRHGQLVPLKEIETIVRLGQGVDASGRIRADAVQRAVVALQRYVALAESYRADEIRCCGTSALRDAVNRHGVVEQLSAAVGVEVEVLTGEQEAELTYLGALSNKPYLGGRVLMVDIGGGSTEFVRGVGRRIEECLSVDVGSVRLTERYLKHDPVDQAEFEQARTALRRALAPLLASFGRWRPDAVLGVAGTVTTLAAMELGLVRYDPKRIDGRRLSREAIGRWIERLRHLPISERARLPGLRPERADVILAGAMILHEVLEGLGMEALTVSHRGLRFGLLLRDAGGP